MQYSVSFPGGTVRYLFNTAFQLVSEQVEPSSCIIITDEHVAALHGKAFEGFKAVIALPAGEDAKNFATTLQAVQQLLAHEAHRKTFILGVGGGMVTDITGFIASIYMRGVRFGYAPTTLLGMVDASIGGKNGINLGLQKNLLGTINQPEFILFDHQFLQTLPAEEWSNGFAEVIKYACLFDEELFNDLSQNNPEYYQNNMAATAALVARCADWKNKTVLADEREQGMRKLLNFGHTAGHAFETVCRIPHGQAVGLGMLVACRLSEAHGLATATTEKLTTLLQQYHLPVIIQADADQLMQVLAMDKKRSDEGVDYILLEAVGKATIQRLHTDTIRKGIEAFLHAGNH